MLLVFRVLFSSLFFTFIFRFFFLLSNFRLYSHHSYLLGVHHTLVEARINYFQPAYVFDTLIYVRHHPLTVISRKQSNSRTGFRNSSILLVQRTQPVAVDVYNLVNMSLPVELFAFLQPLKLLVVRINVQVNHLLQGLLVCFTVTVLDVIHSSKLKKTVKEYTNMVINLHRTRSIEVIIGVFFRFNVLISHFLLPNRLQLLIAFFNLNNS